ncbi:MAG: thiamine pyrophosphate-dependent enzyme, partial [Pseudomonadota bacterium]
PLSGAAERGENIIYVCYDNEAYMNTGVQRSSTTPLGAWTSTTPLGPEGRGKAEVPKYMPLIMAFHGIPYAATASVAFLEDLAEKLKKAKAVKDGLAYIHLLAPCPTGWRAPADLTVELARKAVETNYFPLWEAEHGRFRLTHRPDRPRPVEEFTRLQGRFGHPTGQESSLLQQFVDQRLRLLESLAALGGRQKAEEHHAGSR